MHLKLITTGGTIDGLDCDSDSTPPDESLAAKWLRQQPGIQLEARRLCNKDSRQISTEDRQQLIEEINRSYERRILITHGTFTIAETGRTLKNAFKDTDKLILLVGSWHPLDNPDSDAPSQLQFALQALLSGTSGVWIAMDNRLWDPDKTEKQLINGRYQLIELDI